MRATFKQAIYDKYNKSHVTLVYEYKGYTYQVTKNIYLTEWENKLAIQHKEEQAKIDAKIADKDNPVEIEPAGNDADEAMNMLFRFWNGEEEL